MSNHQSSLNQFDSIVIGSGISGLTASLILAKEGQKVALFERDDDIAPLIRPYKRKGCQCSPGLHFCGWMDEGEVVSSFLNYLSISDGVEKVLYNDAFLNVIIGNDRYCIPRGIANIEKRLLSYFPDSAEAIGAYLKLIREVNEETFYFNNELWPSLNTNHDFTGLANCTLEDCLKGYHASQGLINLLGVLNYTFIGSTAREVPFTTHAFAIGGFYQSPGYFKIDTINRLLSNFKRELIHNGVTLFVRSEVDTITVNRDRNVTGIRTTKGNEYFSPNIVASFNPKLLTGMIKKEVFRPIYRQRLVEAENTFGFYAAFYKVEDDCNLVIDNIVFYDEMSDNHLIITSNISGMDKVLCAFLVEDDWIIPDKSDEREHRASERLETLENILYNKIPGLKGKTVLLDYCKPWSFERYTKTVNGSAYGIKQTINTMGFQHKAPIHGLYLIGQAIFPGFLGSMISSFSLACELFESDKLWSRVKNQ